MNIRLATKKDLEEINRYLKIVVDDINNVKKIDMLWNDEYPFLFIEEFISNKELYVLEKDNEIIGSFRITTKENPEYININWSNKDKFLYLGTVSISPMYQRSGYAKEIINFTSNYAIQNNLKTIRAVVYNENIPSINLCEKMGFKRIKGNYWEYENRIYDAYEKEIDEVLEFYKQTSTYTDLGLYKEFARDLPNDIKELCELQRNQIIHPFDLYDEQMRNDPKSFYGDMTRVSKTSLHYENDILPTAQSMIAELLRRNKEYSKTRPIEDKIHVCCREDAILLASVLKAKGYSARVRSGFAKYVCIGNKEAGDHWITEYYDVNNKIWILVDSDMMYDVETLKLHNIDFNLLNVPRKKFIFAAEAYLGLRTGKYRNDEIHYSSNPITLGLKAALRGLFYDFHSLMNDEIIFLHVPKYIAKKNFELSEKEYKELDELAKLMLDPNKNFKKLKSIWDTKEKYRIMTGGLN